MRTGALTGRFSEGSDGPERLVGLKHDEYFRSAKRYQTVYYMTRICAGLSAGILPFLVRSSPNAAIFFSVLIVVATVADSVFAPKDLWSLYSKATDLLATAQLKRSGRYEKWEADLKIIEETESAALRRLGIQQLLEQLRRNDEDHPSS